MRTVALSLLTSAAFLLSAAHAAIPWQHELRTAHRKAQAEGKLLLLHFYTDNCVWCDRLEDGAFQAPEVAEAIGQRFVPVKVHAAKNPKLAQMFQVTKFPTDVVVTSTGRTLSHSVSPQQADRYVAMLRQAAAAHAPEGAARVAASSPSPANPPAQPAAAAGQPGASRHATGPVPSQVASHRSPSARGASSPSPAAQPNPYAGGPDAVGGTPIGRLAGARTEGMTLQMPGQTQAESPQPESPPSASTPRAAPHRVRSPADAAAAETMAAETTELESAASEPAESRESAPPADRSAEPTDQETPELAMQGFCPVTVIEEDRWAEGKTELGVIHLGKLYLFANEEHRQSFLADPTPYTPVLNEIDVVRFFEERRIVPGKREWGLKDPTHNRMFFFADEAAMDHFWNEHERYTEAAIEVMDQAVRDANPGT